MTQNENTNRRKLKPTPLLDGVEEIRQDFEERIAQGDTTYGLEILDDYVETIRNGSITFIIAAPNCLDLNTSILTKEGFKKVKDITPEDKPLTHWGEETEIISITDTDVIDCYELETTDGRKIITSYNHRFPTYHYGSLNHDGSKKGYIYRSLTAEEISKKLESKWRQNKLFIEEYNNHNNVSKKLPVDPYVLGVLIGDGCLTCKGIRYCKPSQKVFSNVKAGLPKADVRFSSNNKDVIISDGGTIRKYIDSVGLNVHSYEKFIPEEYKYNLSRKQQEELLQGLLDTDGHQRNSYNEYSTTSKQLAIDVQQLAWSLGYRCSIRERMGKYMKNGIVITTRMNYRVIISNSRTKAQCVIKSCKKVSPRKTRCITVESPLHTIVTDNYLVTSNTGKSLTGQLIAVNLAKQGKKVLICSCEMGAGLLMERQLKNLTGTSMKQLRELYSSRRDVANRIMDSVIEDEKYHYLTNIDICETGGATVEDMIEMFDAFPEFEYIIVDYIQRIRGTGSEYENITHAARELQTYARQTGKKLIVCSQASRASNQEAQGQTKKDTKDGMKIRGKGSGSIEEDGDVGLALMEDFQGDEKYILMTLFKNRYGAGKNITYRYKLDNRLNFVLQDKVVI